MTAHQEAVKAHIRKTAGELLSHLILIHNDSFSVADIAAFVAERIQEMTPPKP